ncbi:hypothetical protein VTK56DRAFT_3118 [Thermocarpiscus australiensis]
MKISLQLSFFASSVLGHTYLGHAELCGLGGSSLEAPGSGQVCLAGSDYLEAAPKNITNQSSACESSQCHSGKDCSSPRQHAWTHSSPCFHSAESGQQICVFTDTNFAEGRGISLVTTPRRAAYLATSPAFVEPEVVKGINQDLVRTTPAKYDVREIPGKGMGLVAKERIRRGDPIMANTASLLVDYRAFNELSRDEYISLQAHAVDNLPLAHRAAILNLSTHHGTGLTHAEHVDKIARINAFDIHPDDGDADQEHSFSAVFPDVARMNHDCRPNAEYRFDRAALAQQIRAARDILPGEEITLSYIDPVAGRDARLRRLRAIWGFACACPLCTLDAARAAASDARIAQIRGLRAEFRDWSPTSRACPEMAELMVSLYEQERLWGAMHEAYTFAAIEYNGAGSPWMAVKYARLAVEWGIPMLGETDPDVRELEKLAEDPWSHWSWMRRVKTRNGWGRKEVDRDDDGEGEE